MKRPVALSGRWEGGAELLLGGLTSVSSPETSLGVVGPQGWVDISPQSPLRPMTQKPGWGCCPVD